MVYYRNFSCWMGMQESEQGRSGGELGPSLIKGLKNYKCDSSLFFVRKYCVHLSRSLTGWKGNRLVWPCSPGKTLYSLESPNFSVLHTSLKWIIAKNTKHFGRFFSHKHTHAPKSLLQITHYKSETYIILSERPFQKMHTKNFHPRNLCFRKRN